MPTKSKVCVVSGEVCIVLAGHQLYIYSSQLAGVGTPMLSVTLVRTISFSLYQRSKHVVDYYMTRMTGQSPLKLANQKGQYPTLSTIACFSGAGACAGAVITFISCMSMACHHL
jgi:hypothetical protein